MLVQSIAESTIDHLKGRVPGQLDGCLRAGELLFATLTKIGFARDSNTPNFLATVSLTFTNSAVVVGPMVAYGGLEYLTCSDIVVDYCREDYMEAVYSAVINRLSYVIGNSIDPYADWLAKC